MMVKQRYIFCLIKLFPYIFLFLCNFWPSSAASTFKNTSSTLEAVELSVHDSCNVIWVGLQWPKPKRLELTVVQFFQNVLIFASKMQILMWNHFATYAKVISAKSLNVFKYCNVIRKSQARAMHILSKPVGVHLDFLYFAHCTKNSWVERPADSHQPGRTCK